MTTQIRTETLRAWNNYLAVKLDTDTSTTTAHYLFIPGVNGAAIISGIVVSTGPDLRLPIPVGAQVLIPPHGVGIRTTFHREKYILILDHDVLGYWTTPTERDQP